MNILVIGGTGTVGSEVVNGLLQSGRNGLNIRVMTRSRKKIPGLPDGTEGVIGDLKNKVSLEKAFQDMDRVFFITTPESESETDSGLNAVQAAKNEGINKLVYMSVHRLEDIKAAPHFREKIPIENAIKSSGIPYTLIRPNIFFQNDYWFEEAITTYGVYNQPIGNVGLNGIDVRDIAEAVVNALLTDKFLGNTYALTGNDLLTGDKIAELYSAYLGKEITYTGNDLEGWKASQKEYMSDWLVEDLSMMYRHFLTHGLKATEADLAQTREILGKEPRSYEDFVREVTAQWKKKVGRNQ